MISRRFDYDGKPLLKLNKLQLQMKRQIEEKIASGRYRFETVPCPACDGGNFEPLANKDRYGLYNPVVICTGCGLIQINPHLNQESYSEFYNTEYRKLYSGEEKPTERFFLGQYRDGRGIYDYLQANGLLKDPGKIFVLEVGCGAGGILHYFKEKGCRVKGIDLGETYVEYGRTHHDLDLSVGTINDIELDGVPDLVIYSHVLEHIATPNDELRKVHDILSDTGVLYVAIPGVKNLRNTYKMDFLRMLQNAHVYHFTLASLDNLVEKNGFEIVAGTEKVDAAFRKARDGNKSGNMKNDYAPAMAYLRKLERLRKLYPIPPYKIKNFSKSLLEKILKAVQT